MANTKDKPINKENMRFCLQRAETQQDSLTQKLNNKLGKNDKLTKQAFYVLKQIRTMQFRYLPVKTHSLLRYNDCLIAKNGKIIRPEHKNNWRKIQKEKKRKLLTSLDVYYFK
jgi:hypothetical protein